MSDDERTWGNRRGLPREHEKEVVSHHVAKMDFNPLTFGQVLRVLMVERDLSVAALASLAGVNPNTIGRVRMIGLDQIASRKKERVATPSPLVLIKIIKGLNIIYPVPPQHIVHLFIKCGYAPPMPHIVSQFSSPDQIVVAFDGRGWLPEGHHGRSDAIAPLDPPLYPDWEPDYSTLRINRGYGHVGRVAKISSHTGSPADAAAGEGRDPGSGDLGSAGEPDEEG